MRAIAPPTTQMKITRPGEPKSAARNPVVVKMLGSDHVGNDDGGGAHHADATDQASFRHQRPRLRKDAMMSTGYSKWR